MEKEKRILVWLLLAGGLMLLLAGGIWVLTNQQAGAVLTPTPATADQVERVSLDDAKAAFDAGEAVFLDVRDSRSYAASHIPGAVSIPASELPARSAELDPQAWIIPY